MGVRWAFYFFVGDNKNEDHLLMRMQLQVLATTELSNISVVLGRMSAVYNFTTMCGQQNLNASKHSVLAT
jgi:hypothetical protein